MKTYLPKKGRRGKNEEGFLLVSFIFLMVILAIGVGAFYAFAYADYRASLRNEWMTQAMYVAEAGIDQKLVELMQRNTVNTTGALNFDNAGTYQGTYTTFYGVVSLGPNGNKVLVNPNSGAQMSVTDYAVGDEVIFSTGTVTISGTQRAQKTLRTTVRQSPIVNPRAAVAIAGVASTSGNVTVDGREHDANGNLTGASGVYGVTTSSSSFLQSGSSDVGGNGIAPANPANPAAYELNAPPLPTTPEGILGLGSGALDSYKTTTPPSSPFSGIVYLTTSWTAANLDASSGILIVHNSTGDAVLKNVSGTFKGLIITDDIVHINANAKIIGAVYGLKSGGVTIGNGNADVLFSSQILSGLPLTLYTVTSWEDAQND